ncbi:MAG TPA: trypsin-like peptidase domain-containing protein [Bacteroidia bacterium]
MKNNKLTVQGFVKVCLTVVVSVSLSSCVTLFYPSKQNVTFNTGNKDATVYLDKEKIGKGTLITEKIKKWGAHQIVVKAPGYKDTYAAILQTHRAPGYWVCLFFDVVPGIVFMGYGLMLDPITPKGMSYDDQVALKSIDKIVNRDPADKYIDISNIRLDIKDKDKDLNYYYIFHKKGDLMKDIEDAEKKYDDKAAKEELKKAKKKEKKEKLEEESDSKDIKYDDTKFSYNVYQTLKKTGYVDTVNKVFTDNNNTLILEGSIKKVAQYRIYGKRAYLGHYYKSKVTLRWYIKNTYNEILDSVDTKEFSGDFVYDDKDNFYEKMYGDAVDISYLKLQRDGKLAKYMKQETNFKISDQLLSIPVLNASSAIADKGDAAEASVIIKRQDKGHGSGFAISQNGYIITNYHVVAGKQAGKPSSIKVVTSTGEELDATVVRYNKFRDLALIKVNKNFDKAFKVSNVKAFKNMMDVYAIGAPKSIELGQSVSSGVISNERKSNNNNLLQLGMSVNSGNSGGPVFDSQGNLHGVVVSKMFGANTEGISFAIPGYMIQDYLNINYGNGGGSTPSNNTPAKGTTNTPAKGTTNTPAKKGNVKSGKK